MIFKLFNSTINLCLYLFIGPFTALFITPRFFRQIELSIGISLPKYFVLDIIGMFFMWSGAAIAAWCSILMLLNKYGSINPMEKPTKLVTKGIFNIVRHPMMWSLFFVIFGEVLSFSSPLTFLWLLIWVKFSIIYIDKYEEPYLVRVFGNEYKEYCRNVPRWIPNF